VLRTVEAELELAPAGMEGQRHAEGAAEPLRGQHYPLGGLPVDEEQRSRLRDGV
jgi:hypothetical protein